jgi:hypothetical protein
LRRSVASSGLGGSSAPETAHRGRRRALPGTVGVGVGVGVGKKLADAKQHVEGIVEYLGAQR